MSATYGTPRLYRSAVRYRGDVLYRSVASWTLATTRLDAATQDATFGSQRVSVSTLGLSSTLVGRSVTVPLQTAIRTDQAVSLILDAAGWPGGKRAISTGDTTLAYWWADGKSAWDALLEVTAAEGPATLYEDETGTLHWENRNYRAVTPRSTTSQATFFDKRVSDGLPYRSAIAYRGERLYRGNAVALYFTALAYEPGWSTTYARATYATKRRALGALGVVWSYGADMTLSSGQTRTLFVRPSDPFQSAVTPVLGTDYALLSGTATIALDASSGFVGILTITAGGSGCTIRGPAATPTSGLQLRARPLTVVSETVVQSTIDTSGSASAYRGIQTLDVAGWPEIDPAMAEAVCDAWVVRYRIQRPQVTISVVAGDDAHARQILTRGVSDRITLRSEATGIAADVWIESREIVVSGAGGRRVEAIWKCEKVDTVSGSLWDAATTLWDNPTTLWGI
jgi:hypothetical protein